MSGGPASPGGYEILRELGRGGMGVVYLARHLALDRTVALKMILHGDHAGTANLERFLAEAQAVARLQHANIVQIFESGQYAGLPYFTLEYIAGGSLADKVRQQPLAPREAAQLALELARGIGYAHERGIIHRDLKPENVLLAPDGTPKITDFGLAKRVESGGNLTSAGAILGTPSYMSPEQASGNRAAVGPASDVYSLGAILYRLLTGRPPFQAATPLDTLLLVISTEPVPPSQLQPTVPRDLETIALKCLQKEPGRRYASALALAEDLTRFLAGEPVQARPVSAVERAVKWVRRRPAVAALAASLVLMLLAGTAVSTWFAFQAADRADDADRSALDAKSKAELAKVKEKEALDQRDDANKQREEVRKANDQLRDKQEELRQALYGAHMNLIQTAWDADNIARARDLLGQLVPRSDQTDLRGFEWHYWDRLCHRELWTANLGSQDLVTFSADAARCAAVARTPLPDKPFAFHCALRVWDTRSGKEHLTIEEADGFITNPAFSADGKRLVAIVNRDLKMWDAATGKKLFAVTCPEGVTQVTCSADGKRLIAVVSGHKTNSVKVWNVESGKDIANHNLPSTTGYKVAFSRDGQRFALTTRAGPFDEVSVWDIGTGQLTTCRLPMYERLDFSQLTFSGDGKRIALPVIRLDEDLFKVIEKAIQSGKFEPDLMKQVQDAATGVLRVWDAESCKELVVLKGIPVTRVGVAFSPDGSEIAVLDASAGSLRIWDSTTGKLKFSPTGGGEPVAGVQPILTLLEPRLVYSRDGKLLCTAGFGATVKVWGLARGQLRLHLKGHTGAVAEIAVSPDAKSIYSAAIDGTMKGWDISTPDEPIKLPTGSGGFGALGTIALSHDGKRAAVADLIVNFADPANAKNYYELKVLDVGTQKELFGIKLGEGTQFVRSITFSPDGRRLAGVVSIVDAKKDSSELKVWDATSGKELCSIQSGDGRFGSLAFSNDGRLLAGVIFADKGLKETVAMKLWDGITGNEILTFPCGGPPLSMPFSPDGKWLAVPRAGKQSTLVAFRDTSTGTELRTIDLGSDKSGRLAVSPDGKLLAVVLATTNILDSATELQVWDLATGQKRFAHSLSGQNVLLTFTRDGKRLATISGVNLATGQSGSEIKIWETATGLELLTLKGPIAMPAGFAFSADASKLLLVGQDMLMSQVLLQVWDATPRHQKTAAK
jgi:WD40 repeat protein